MKTKNLRYVIFILFFLFIESKDVLAQTTNFNSLSYNSMRRNVATVIYSGLAGAVLGMSTLSFYGEPQEHIDNIYFGFLTGMLFGGVYLSSSTNNSEAINENSLSYAPFPPTYPHFSEFHLNKSHQVNIKKRIIFPLWVSTF